MVIVVVVVMVIMLALTGILHRRMWFAEGGHELGDHLLFIHGGFYQIQTLHHLVLASPLNLPCTCIPTCMVLPSPYYCKLVVS